MGCGQFFHTRFDELGFLLKEYEKTLDLISREKVPEGKKTEYELNNEERKEQIRVLLDDLNAYFEKKPNDPRFDRFQKLNIKFQFLLKEESHIINEGKEEEKSIGEGKKEVRFLPNFL